MKSATASTLPQPPLHSLHPLPRRHFNRLFAAAYTASLSSLLYHHFLKLLNSASSISLLISLSLLFSDLILAFMWSTSQAFRMNPVHRHEHPEHLEKALDRRDFPGLDIFICTADPFKEPPIDVVNTALSVMAYDYPAEKVSVYVSDDGGSELTMFAFMEAARFGRLWLPFCRENKVAERCPHAYFSSTYDLTAKTLEIKGPNYVGTGMFFQTDGPSLEALLHTYLLKALELSPDYIVEKPINGKEMLGKAHQVAGCYYENKTSWGSKIGFRYGSLVEDYYTGYRLQCEGEEMVGWAFRVPSLALLQGLPIFPKVSEPWFLLYAFLFLGSYGQDCFDFISTRGTFRRWWSDQRMWLMRAPSAFYFGMVEYISKCLASLATLNLVAFLAGFLRVFNDGEFDASSSRCSLLVLEC
ncbi:hypothetical protein SASPL_151160 [Salvia splendens]|uniref:Cellulose synthase A n=1 Tax=Salvia splendens TaxID=180675 RepID=A0A8X8Z3G8_SALSN|nr:hypothetical protein SASPL_151160 [Salvia splendens]